MQTDTIEICPGTTQRWIRAGALLVDVREQYEVEQLAFVAPNIVHIPISEFEARYTELPSDRDLVVVCQVGVRSLEAAYFLRNRGYKNTVHMRNGIVRWVQKGYPTLGDISGIPAHHCNHGHHHHKHAENGASCGCSHDHDNEC